MLKRAQKAQAATTQTIYKNLPDINTTGPEVTANTTESTQSADLAKSEVTPGANEAQERQSKVTKGKMHWKFKLIKAKAAAKMVKREEGRNWVHLYKYISSKPEVPLVGKFRNFRFIGKKTC